MCIFGPFTCLIVCVLVLAWYVVTWFEFVCFVWCDIALGVGCCLICVLGILCELVLF